MPSSFPKMDEQFPAHFADFNVLVKAHSLSFFGGKKKSHRRLMELWARSPNVHVASYDDFDPLPYMASADLLISDESSVLFEFAALERPLVWCDFLWVHWTRRGPLAYRLKRRLDGSIEPYRAMAAHAPRYRDLRRIVEEELAQPQRFDAARRAAVSALVGPTDGKVSERIADHLLAQAGRPRIRRALANA
jgi:CDP-glycerol glycerophosphotransferase (TagB/SpsB family)